jgi:hypothetical protein
MEAEWADRNQGKALGVFELYVLRENLVNPVPPLRLAD